VLARCACHSHGGAIPLAECGTALDVGAEEGDGAGGEIRHDPLQMLGEMSFRPIVAWEETEAGTQAAIVEAHLMLGAAPAC
jgi:hypothetical protein